MLNFYIAKAFRSAPFKILNYNFHGHDTMAILYMYE